jgi:hypothetical protein
MGGTAGSASGGGGQGSNSTATATSGSVNTGGGGGGGGGTQGTCSNGNGGAGGSGVVILRYPNIYTATFSGGVTQTTSTDGAYKISTVTATSTTSETVSFA